LSYEEPPDPDAGHGEVVVDSEAIGVNYLDITAPTGQRPGPLPFLPGHEGAGTVSAVGSGVTGISVGDRVAWARPGVSSSYAERMAVPAQWILPLPSSTVSTEE
jgi:NADPH:quinone reductase